MNKLYTVAAGVAIAQLSKVVVNGIELSPDMYEAYRSKMEKIERVVNDLADIDTTKPMTIAHTAHKFVASRIRKSHDPKRRSKPPFLTVAQIDSILKEGIKRTKAVGLPAGDQLHKLTFVRSRANDSPVGQFAALHPPSSVIIGGLDPQEASALGMHNMYVVYRTYPLSVFGEPPADPDSEETVLERMKAQKFSITRVTVVHLENKVDVDLMRNADPAGFWAPRTGDDSIPERRSVVFDEFFSYLPEDELIREFRSTIWAELGHITYLGCFDANYSLLLNYGVLLFSLQGNSEKAAPTASTSPTMTPLVVPEKKRRFVGPHLEMVDDWRAYMQAGVPLTVLLVGRPGGGKTTFMYTAIEKLKTGRVLHIGNEQFAELSMNAWRTMLRMLEPDIVVIEDIDRVPREKLSLSLNKIDRQQYRVPLTIMSANDRNRMPPAFTRPGRIDNVVLVDASLSGVVSNIQTIMERMGKDPAEVPPDRIEALAARMEGRTPAEIEKHVVRAIVLGWDRDPCKYDLDVVTGEDAEEIPARVAGVAKDAPSNAAVAVYRQAARQAQIRAATEIPE